MFMPVLSSTRAPALWLLLLSLLGFAANGQAQQFASGALRGLQHVNVAVDGFAPDFARYGLSAQEMRQHVEQKLAAAGLTVADDEAALRDAAVGQVRVKLTAVESSYGFYSYALALEARRKIPLSAEGGFVSQNVWAKGQSGISNPSDLRKLYPVVDQLLAEFLSAHGSDNVASAHH